MRLRKSVLCLMMFLIASAPVVTAQDAQPAKAKPEAFFLDFLDGLTTGEAIEADQITVFPIIAKEAPPANAVLPDTRTDQLLYEELDWPERPFNVGITNRASEPVLLLGGSLLVGGKLDRMVPEDILLPSKQQREIETLPAEYPKDRRREAAPFRRGSSLAPEFLRERGVFDPSRYLVPIFVSHFLEFRNPGDERRSLQAIDDSALLATYCIECQKALAEFPDISEGKVVGFATAVRGRLHGVELFGTNDLLRAYFQPILRAHTYQAAAIALRAEKVGVPLPESEAEKKKAVAKAKKDLDKLLGELGNARFRSGRVSPNTFGTDILVRTSSSQGTALGYGERLVHAAIFPANPFEEALFSRPLEPPPESSGVEESFGELSRREERGTLTEAERRILERMRQRRNR